MIRIAEGIAQNSTLLRQGAQLSPTQANNFTNIMNDKKQLLQSKLAESINALEQNWQSVRARTSDKLKAVPEQARALVELQLEVNELQIKTTAMSKVGETLGSTLRRLQQMG